MSIDISSFVGNELCTSIFYTLIHSLWQIPVVALFIKMMVKRKSKPSTLGSYNANFAAIVMSILMALFTFLFYFLSNNGSSNNLNTALANTPLNYDPSAVGYISSSVPVSMSWTEWLLQYDRYIVLFWSIGVILLLARIVAGWLGIYFIKKNLNFNIPFELKAAFVSAKQRLGLTQIVQIALSPISTIPMVIGHLKPIVILPISTLNQLSPEEVEAILIHELSHIMQYDFVKNLIVMLGESLFFYHPVLWMLSSEIREEREHCCDDVVMKLCPDRIQYANTLVKLEEMQLSSPSNLSLALFNTKFKLMKRVKRILNLPGESNNGKMKFTIVALLMCSLIVFSSADLMIKKSNPDNEAMPLPESIDEQSTDPFASIIPAAYAVSKKQEQSEDIPTASLSDIDLEARSFSKPELKNTLSVTDTLPKEERAKLRAELAEKRRELQEKSREMRDKMRVQRDRIQAEYREELRKKREELREVREKMRKEGHSFNDASDFEFEFNQEELAEWSKKMGEWGAEFGENFSKNFDDKWKEDMAGMGDKMTEVFDKEWAMKWEKYGENLGENISKIFDEKWHKDMAHLGEDISASFNDEWLEDISMMGAEIAASVSEAMEGMDDNQFNYNYNYGHFNNRLSLKMKLVDALNSDGLLTDQKNTIIISDQEMTVNGKVQPISKLKLYQSIVKSVDSSAFTDGPTKVRFELNGKTLDGSKSTSLSVEVDDN